MDFGPTEFEADRFAQHLTRNNPAPTIHRPAEVGFGEMLDRIERMIDADVALRGLFVSRFASHLAAAEETKVSLEPFPRDPGTVELSIWDNQPHGRRIKVEGDSSRDKPARYAIDLRACHKGHSKPLTTKTPDFRANVGDLFTGEQIQARLKRAWKGMDPVEVQWLRDEILPLTAQGFLVARLCYKRAARLGGGTHWHPYHYALVGEQELIDRDVRGVLLVTADGAQMLPPCSTLDATGKPFRVVTKVTKSGASRDSVVVGQSRATDLTSARMQAWATGTITAS